MDNARDELLVVQPIKRAEGSGVDKNKSKKAVKSGRTMSAALRAAFDASSRPYRVHYLYILEWTIPGVVTEIYTPDDPRCGTARLDPARPVS